MTVKVLVNTLGREIEAEEGAVLLDVLRDAGVRIESLCGCSGKCGKCKVILKRGSIEKVDTEPDKFLSPQELEEGYYLACMTKLLGDRTFTIPAESRIESPKILLSAELRFDKLDPSSSKHLTEVSPFAREMYGHISRVISIKFISEVIDPFLVRDWD